ncbi:MAG: acyclic terpene utilization AtuA family protein [Thermosulfidibacteraceae bacterium]|jgi:hypothetical protein
MEGLLIFSPQGMLGYGYPSESFERAISFKPAMIGVDAGSTDAGPYRLGSGKPTVSRYAVKKDLIPMINYTKREGVPLIIGSAGGAGTREHVNWVLNIVWEIAKENHINLKCAIIYSDVNKDWLKNKLRKGLVKPLGPVGELTEDEIDVARNIVGVMGIAPYIEALSKNVDIVIAGRSNDPAIFASFAVYKGIPYEIAFHAGKILECGAIASVPGTASDGMLAWLYKDRLIVEPSNPKRVCNILSVSAHSLYEKEHPYLLRGPEGTLNLKYAIFEELNERQVMVRNQIFEKSNETWIKLEGAKYLGKRYACIALITDPLMIKAEDIWKSVLEEEVNKYFGGERFHFLIRTFGEREKVLILEAVSKNEELAKAIVSWARSFLMHYHYPGRKATSGNLAIIYSPSEMEVGDTYAFNIHHLVKLENQGELFETEIVKIN